MDWNDQFLELYDRCLAQYQSGNHDFNSYYSDADIAFLQSIGYKPRELFDFVEDFGDSGVPTRSTALLVAAARRDYFNIVMDQQLSDAEYNGSDIPGKGEALEGITYLPRIFKKAQLKLRGEMDPNLMFGCGGDRGFLKRNGDIPMADFLRHVWASDGDIQKLVEFIKGKA